MKEQFQIHSMYEGTSLQAELLSLSCSKDKLWVVEIVVVQFVHFVLCQRFKKKQEANAFESLWISGCYSFPLFCNVNTTSNPLNIFWILSLHNLMNLRFWWYTASDDVITSGALLTSRAVLLQTLLSFLFVQFFVLFCSFSTHKWSQFFFV